jgi:hypothetical protein
MLTGAEISKATGNVYRYLDTIDLLPFVQAFKGKTVHDLMNQ